MFHASLLSTGLQGLSTSDHNALTTSPPSAGQPSLTTTSDCVDQESNARLKGALHKLMNGLDIRRQANKRPEDLHVSGECTVNYIA